MKIEKVNSNQIRCTLNKSDLTNREIKISELAYGTEKAQELFKDMMEQASHEFGFDADNIPLMIEAIPLTSDSIMLIITKVDNPDELDEKIANIPGKNIRKFKKKEIAKSETKMDEKSETSNKIDVLVYSFKSLDEASKSASIIHSLYDGINSLYKNESTNEFILVLHRPIESSSPFKGLHGLLSEYGEKLKASNLIEVFYEEHYETIIKDQAIQILSTI